MSYLEYREVPQPLEARIEIARSNNKYHDEYLDPNCFGTAFFLLGVLPYDMVILTNNNNKNIRDALGLMEESDKPKKNSLLASYHDGELLHTAFIRETKFWGAIRGYHRTGSCGPFKEIKNLKTVEEYLTKVHLPYLRLCKRIGQEQTKLKFSHRFFSLSDKDLTPWAKNIVEMYDPYWWA